MVMHGFGILVGSAINVAIEIEVIGHISASRAVTQASSTVLESSWVALSTLIFKSR